jgi:hypothetical protein
MDLDYQTFVIFLSFDLDLIANTGKIVYKELYEPCRVRLPIGGRYKSFRNRA